MNTLVTGSNGFVGKRVLAELLDLGHTPIALIKDFNRKTDNELLDKVRAKGAVVVGSITDKDLIRSTVSKYELDYVIHLAAMPIVQICNSDPWTAYQVNTLGTIVLYEAIRDQLQSSKNIRLQKIIHMSSDKAYGDSAPPEGYREDTPFSVTDTYCVSKACGDMIARSYAKTYGLPICVVRCGNLYGGGDLNLSRLIPGNILRLFNNQSPVIYRDAGEMRREFIHVSDVVSAYKVLLEKGIPGEAYNIGGTKPYTIFDVMQMIQNKINPDIPIRIVERSLFEITYQALQSDKLQALGWEAQYDLDKGLDEAIAWYRNWWGRATKHV